MNSASQTFIARPDYIAQLSTWRDKNEIIKVVTGIRRCGKSTMFYLYQLDLMMHFNVLPAQIQQINFEDANYSDLLDWKKLHDHILNNVVPDKMNYVFLDEIQNVEHFEKAINSLRIKGNIDIYITGSNSRILSSELATMLSGRYITIHMQPLSFSEYVSAYFAEGVGSWTARTRESVLNPRSRDYIAMFQDYLHNSSFPYTVQLLKFTDVSIPNTKPLVNDQVRQFLQGLFDTIVLKDVIERKKIKDVSRLKKVIKFMFDNIGNETSILNIAKLLEKDSGVKIDPVTVESYLEAFIDTFVLYKADRYDIKGKQYLKTNSKYYVADIGLRYLLLGREGDTGHILENIVYLELLRRGYNVYVGKVGTREVDFVATKDGVTEYYQVSQTVANQDTLDRELRSLDEIDDHNSKFLITMDRPLQESFKGIKIINAFDWLLDK
ncbi:MAG: ATP-binding protein [Alphaproteobacteria bacterium]|nr:ATP-binding protein [Alphaproteobacteria bacterium]MBN2675442.1 ATP-binding protein [Alphaproteobacteria bacterium]